MAARATPRLAIEGGTPVRSTLLPYGRQTIDEDDERAVLATLRSDWLTSGPMVRQFEEALAETCGAKHAVAVATGTAALHCAAHVAGVAGRALLTSPLSFSASSNCALYVGGEARFADVERDTGNLDPARVEAALAAEPGKIRAIVPVHLGGNPCRLDELARVVPDGTLVIEDAAHALGASYQGSPIGSCRHSSMAILSFHPVKQITTGEGGAVLTNDDAIAAACRQFRDHGIRRERVGDQPWDGPWFYRLEELGYNYRITDLQCALGLSQLRKLERFCAARRAIAARYLRELAALDLVDLPVVTKDAESAWHLFIVELKLEKLRVGRREVFEALRAEGIGVQVHYIPIHRHPLYRERYGFADEAFPIAQMRYERTLSLPVFPRMTEDDARDVIDALGKVLEYYRA